MIIQTHKLFQCVTILFVGHLSYQCPAGLRGKRWICNHLGFEETHHTSVDPISLIRIVTWLHLGVTGYAASGQLLPRLYTMGYVCVCVRVCVCMCMPSHVQFFVTPWTAALQALPWNSPDKISGVHCHFLLQGIFLIQGLNLWLLSLLHWQADSSLLAPPGKPLHYGRREWVLVNCLLSLLGFLTKLFYNITSH